MQAMDLYCNVLYEPPLGGSTFDQFALGYVVASARSFQSNSNGHVQV